MANPSTRAPQTSLGASPSDGLSAGAAALTATGHGHDVHGSHHPRLQHHFYNMDQQLEASTLGMWVFLVTEIMFFGGLFMAYIVYRYWYPGAWVSASNHLDVGLGALNTGVLIFSSLTMALAVRCAQVGSRMGIVVNLIFTILFGATFLVVKYFEYAAKFTTGPGHEDGTLIPGPTFSPSLPKAEQLFFALYFIMTGIHAAHMVVGIGIMLVILAMAWKGRFGPDYYGPVEVSGLYWHFVDIVWIFLFPLLYLLGAHFGGGH